MNTREGMVFGCMTPEERKALGDALLQGRPLHYWHRGGWNQHYGAFNKLSDDGIYRIAPPPVEPFTVDPIVWQVLDKRWRWITGEGEGMAWMSKPKPHDYSTDAWVGAGAMSLRMLIAPGLIQRGACPWQEAIAERPEDTP